MKHVTVPVTPIIYRMPKLLEVKVLVGTAFGRGEASGGRGVIGGSEYA